jgi:hypothetical protein
MDRLFADSAGNRRRFLDRLTLALEPGHATHAARYEAAMRARNKLLAEPEGADPSWLAALEAGMAEHGAALGAARARTISALDEALAGQGGDDFPRAALLLEGWSEVDLAASLRANRGRDAAAGRATAGPHRQDLIVTHVAKNQPASRSSTGEQKALLLGIVLAHAELVASRRGARPILLLDEVAAHLDPARRAKLDRRAKGAPPRHRPCPCRARREPPRCAADPAARRSGRAPRSRAPRRLVRAHRRPRAGVDDRHRARSVRRNRRRCVALPRRQRIGRSRLTGHLRIFDYIALQHETPLQAA